MNAPNTPQQAPDAAGTTPSASLASTAPQPKRPSSSPNRSAYPIRMATAARLPLTVEQILFLTLAVVMFATALVALQVVLVVTFLLTRLH